MKEINDSIFYWPGAGLFCQVDSDNVHGYFSVQGLESMILTERIHARDTEYLEQALFLLREYNHSFNPPADQLLE